MKLLISLLFGTISILAEKTAQDPKVSFNLVSHICGGFYSFFVANRQKFTIKNIRREQVRFYGGLADYLQTIF